ncbi:MAG: flagellar biosynthesis protein [Subtercola sp.]|nr:flagellar biosynthesis protein [Subtercola sp.]
MFESELVAGLRFAPRGPEDGSAVRVQLRLPWYRSLQLRCIERLELTIDGETLPEEGLTIVINGASHPLSEVQQSHEVWWFVLDLLEVELDSAQNVAPGTHRVSATLALQIPYGDKDWRAGLDIKQLAECTKELTLAGRDE